MYETPTFWECDCQHKLRLICMHAPQKRSMTIYQSFTQHCTCKSNLWGGVKIRISTIKLLVPTLSIRFRAVFKDRISLHAIFDIYHACLAPVSRLDMPYQPGDSIGSIYFMQSHTSSKLHMVCFTPPWSLTSMKHYTHCLSGNLVGYFTVVEIRNQCAGRTITFGLGVIVVVSFACISGNMSENGNPRPGSTLVDYM